MTKLDFLLFYKVKLACSTFYHYEVSIIAIVVLSAV